MGDGRLDPDIERTTLDAGSSMEGVPLPHLDHDGAVASGEQHTTLGRRPGRTVGDDGNETQIFLLQDFSQKTPLVGQQTMIHQKTSVFVRKDDSERLNIVDMMISCLCARFRD
jgi:hypothetical protein